jgi:flotillin
MNQQALIKGAGYGIFTLFLLYALVALIKTRYRRFTNRDFVLSFRNGKLRSQGYGGGYFVLPFIDELVVLSTVIQTLEISAESKVITRENQSVIVNGLVIWRIEDPSKAYQSISGEHNGSIHEINMTLERLVESIIRTTVARLTLDEVLRERSLIIEAILSELLPVVEPMGIKINTAEIRHVDVVNEQLFKDLQESYRQEARLFAEKTKINTDQEIQKREAESTQSVRFFQAEQEETAARRELQKDREILIEQQKLQESDQQRMKSVQELEMKRESSVAQITQEKLEIEARTKLIQIELEAESKKRQEILENIEVEAQSKKLLAEANAEAIKMEAHARRQAVELEADAEAYKLSKIAAARKESLLAEAEGQKALLIAEAEGLREKVDAQGQVNEAMIMQELVKQLPAIAASMKVGDINWLNMGGNGKDGGDTPLGIIPKNLLQVMSLAKSFGFDLEKLIQSVRGSYPPSDSEDSEKKSKDKLLPFPSGEKAEPLANKNTS